MSDSGESLSESEAIKRRFIDIVDWYAYAEGNEISDVSSIGKWTLNIPNLFIKADGIEFANAESLDPEDRFHSIEFYDGDRIVYILLLDRSGFGEVRGGSDLERLESNDAAIRVMSAVQFYEQQGYMTRPVVA